jgi:uncharacterized DUF497 family protein
MRFKSFKWDLNNIAHIAEHGVSPEEAEETCYNNPLILKSRLHRYYVLGQTDNGRYLTVVVAPIDKVKIRVITAREMSEAERQRFQRR